MFLDVAHVPKGKSISIEYVLRFVNHKDPNDSIKKGMISLWLFLLLDNFALFQSRTKIRFGFRNVFLIWHPEFKTTFPIKNGQGWGDRKAIKNTQMEQAGFLKDDTFYIEAEIAVKKVMWTV